MTSRRTGGARPALPVPAAVAALCAVLALSGCADARSNAEDAAAERVRTSATATRALVRDVVFDPDAPRGPALRDRVREQVPGGPDVLTFHEAVTADGVVVLRVAFHARGESGGGLSHESVVARLCVEFTADPGPPPAAEVRDVPCPAGLPAATGNAGNVDVTVTLEG